MKANEAPEKIYCTPTEGGFYFTTIKPEPPFDEGVEYIKKDDFVKKACEYLMEYEFNDSPTIADRRKRVDEFIKYMEGE